MKKIKKKLQVHCPKCNKLIDYYKSDFRPFCSRLCSLEDLAAWASNEYVLPAETRLDDTQEKVLLKAFKVDVDRGVDSDDFYDLDNLDPDKNLLN